MPIITSNGFYFSGKAKELLCFLLHLRNHYTLVTQFLKKNH